MVLETPDTPIQETPTGSDYLQVLATLDSYITHCLQYPKNTKSNEVNLDALFSSSSLLLESAMTHDEFFLPTVHMLEKLGKLKMQSNTATTESKDRYIDFITNITDCVMHKIYEEFLCNPDEHKTRLAVLRMLTNTTTLINDTDVGDDSTIRSKVLPYLGKIIQIQHDEGEWALAYEMFKFSDDIIQVNELIQILQGALYASVNLQKKALLCMQKIQYLSGYTCESGIPLIQVKIMNIWNRWLDTYHLRESYFDDIFALTKYSTHELMQKSLREGSEVLQFEEKHPGVIQEITYTYGRCSFPVIKQYAEYLLPAFPTYQKIALRMQSYGLDYAQMLEDFQCIGLNARRCIRGLAFNIKMIDVLEHTYPGEGICSLLQKSYGIRYFYRYNADDLIRQFKAHGKTLRRGFIMTVEADARDDSFAAVETFFKSSNAPRGIHHWIHQFIKDLRHIDQAILPTFVEASNMLEGVKRVNMVRKISTGEKIAFGMLVAHGNDETITFSGRELPFKTNMLNAEDLRRKGTKAVFSAFEADAPIISFACLSGIPAGDGICLTASLYGNHVWGPMEVKGLDQLTVLKDFENAEGIDRGEEVIVKEKGSKFVGISVGWEDGSTGHYHNGKSIR